MSSCVQSTKYASQILTSQLVPSDAPYDRKMQTCKVDKSFKQWLAQRASKVSGEKPRNNWRIDQILVYLYKFCLVLLVVVWYHRPQQEYLEANVAKIPGNCLSWPSSRGPCLGANCASHFATLPTDFRNYFDPSFGQLQWLVDSCNCIKSWLCICFEVGTH